MIRILLLLIVFGSATCLAQKPQVNHVIKHNRTTVVCNCNPATGSKSYAKWGVFPSIDFPVRKTVMNVTLGSPDSLLTAHWD